MRALTFVVPGTLQTRTGGSIYDRRVIEGLRGRGWNVSVIEIDLSVTARAATVDLPAGLVIIDGLVYCEIVHSGTFETRPSDGRPLVAVPLIHLPLAETPGLSPADAAVREAAERRALGRAAAVIVTGDAAAATMRRYGVPPPKISVAEPGTDRLPLARGSSGDHVELLCVATVNAGKGYDVLLQALARIRQLPWRLTCAGSLERDPLTAREVRRLAGALDLHDRVAWCGDLDAEALSARYDAADLFVLATRYETYGMAVAEALAHGLPVVTTATGAASQLVGQPSRIARVGQVGRIGELDHAGRAGQLGGAGSPAGIVVPVDDAAALAEAIAAMVSDPDLRARYAAGARRVRDTLPPWTRTVDIIERVLLELLNRGDVTG